MQSMSPHSGTGVQFWTLSWAEIWDPVDAGWVAPKSTGSCPYQAWGQGSPPLATAFPDSCPCHTSWSLLGPGSQAWKSQGDWVEAWVLVGKLPLHPIVVPLTLWATLTSPEDKGRHPTGSPTPSWLPGTLGVGPLVAELVLCS